jgi:hypothetical protein
MKAFGLLQNLGERAHIRSLIAKLNPTLPGSPDSAALALSSEGPFDILILDERFDEEKDSSSRRNGLSVIEVLDMHRERFPDAQPWVLLILNEYVTPDRVLLLSKKGVDLFLLRPFGLKDLGDKVMATIKCIASPPALLDTYHKRRESFLNAANDGDVQFLRDLRAFSDGDLPVTMLLVQVLLQNPGTTTEALNLLRDLAIKYPESLSVRAALVAALCREKIIGEAFANAQVLCRIAPTEKHFQLALGLARKSQGSEPLLQWADKLCEFAGDTARKARLDALNELIRRSDNESAVADMLRYLERNRDLRENVADGIIQLARTWLKRSGESGFELLEAAVTCDPGTPLIETWVDAKLAKNDFKTPVEVLERARRLKKFGEEHYASAIRLALAEKNLKEASDQLHQARRFAPSSERWETLAEAWKAMYKSISTH